MNIKFSILVQPNPDFESDEDSIELDYSEQCIYCILRSYDNGLTWHHFFTMVSSDQDEIRSFVNDLNYFYAVKPAKKPVISKPQENYNPDEKYKNPKTSKLIPSQIPLPKEDNNKKYKGAIS